jgi:hypothetical protein
MRVLPTPGGPSSRTASLLMMNRLPAISRTCALSIDGCALKSKPARSRAKGKRTRPQVMSMRRWSRRAISRSQNSARCQRARKIDSPANVVLAALSFVDAGGEALRDAEAVLDFAQGEQPAVGAQVPGIEPGDDRLAADR